jgi:hypothetical protein
MLSLRPLSLVALLAAPLQCPSRRPPELTREDRPDEALWELGERFASARQRGARARSTCAT